MPDPDLGRLLARVVDGPVGPHPVDRAHPPVGERADVEAVDRPQRRRHLVGRHQVAEAVDVRVPLAGQLVGHHAVRARAVAVVVRVVVAAPQAPVERDLARSNQPSQRPTASSLPSRRAISSAAATAASHSYPARRTGPHRPGRRLVGPPLVLEQAVAIPIELRQPRQHGVDGRPDVADQGITLRGAAP